MLFLVIRVSRHECVCVIVVNMMDHLLAWRCTFARLHGVSSTMHVAVSIVHARDWF
jgi:hypothetical protein